MKTIVHEMIDTLTHFDADTYLQNNIYENEDSLFNDLFEQVTSTNNISSEDQQAWELCTRHKQVKQLFQTCVTDVEEALHEMKDLQQQGQYTCGNYLNFR
nr:hypothetical protein [Bacillus cereus]